MEKLKEEFFSKFSDQMDKENDYYDSQFEGQTPSDVWKWINKNFIPLGVCIKGIEINAGRYNDFVKYNIRSSEAIPIDQVCVYHTNGTIQKFMVD